MDIKLSNFIVSLLLIIFFITSFLSQKTVVIKTKEDLISITTFKRRVYGLFDGEISSFNFRDVKNANPFDFLREGMVLEIKE